MAIEVCLFHRMMIFVFFFSFSLFLPFLASSRFCVTNTNRRDEKKNLRSLSAAGTTAAQLAADGVGREMVNVLAVG